ncbi:MAG: methyltransferase [Nocardioidaceae bacterium]
MAEADDVVWMVRGAWVSMCVRATCELGIVDALDEPQSLPELATRTSSDPATLTRLLRVLVDLGLLSLGDEGRYAATSRGEVLRIGHPSGVRNLALMQTEIISNLSVWQHLADAVRHGDAVFENLHGVTLWAWLAANPEKEAVFDASMARRAALQVEAVRAAQALSGAALVVDVGGGQGAMLAGLLEHDPPLHGIVADRPEVAAAATARLAAAGLGERAWGEPADFFVMVPTGGDFYVLSNVLHDWNDAEAASILRVVHAAMSTEAHLLVVENVLDAPGRTPSQERDVHLVDLHMLLMFGAQERTKAEYDALLVAAGFAPSTLGPSPNTWNVMETQPAN